MAAAVVDRKIKSNPCSTTKLPKDRGSARLVPLTTEQVLRVREGVPPELRALITLGAGTGMRQSEMFGLTRDRLDLRRQLVTIDRQVLTVPGVGPAFGPPKTRASVRDVPLPRIVLDDLARHLEAFPPLAHGEFTGLVFHHDGGPWTRQRFGHIWRPVIAAEQLQPGTGSHALRHYYASLLIRHGESVKTVQARLGHASAAETLDTYSHLWPDSEDRTRDAVDSALDVLRTARGQQESISPEPAGQSPGADGLARRPGSVRRGASRPPRVATIHLRRPLPTASSDLPASSGGPPSSTRCSVLLQVGFAEPRRSPAALVVSCTTVSPLPPPASRRWRSVLCGTVPRVAPGGCCPPPRPAEPGPSSTCRSPGTTRSPGQPVRRARIGHRVGAREA